MGWKDRRSNRKSVSSNGGGRERRDQGEIRAGIIDPARQKLDNKSFSLQGNLFYGKKIESILKDVIMGEGRGKIIGGMLPDYEIAQSSIDVEDFYDSAGYMTKSEADAGNWESRGRFLVMWGLDSTPYRVFCLQNIPVVRSEFRNRYELCQEVMRRLWAEFYCDPSGNIMAHPMRVSTDMCLNGAR